MAVNILLVSMLEEMYKAEQLWASHAGSSKLSTQSSRYNIFFRQGTAKIFAESVCFSSSIAVCRDEIRSLCCT